VIFLHIVPKAEAGQEVHESWLDQINKAEHHLNEVISGDAGQFFKAS
jgi:hypothetical protein